VFSLFKKDVSAYFNSQIGYFTIGLFLLVTGLFLWVFPGTDVFYFGYASLESFFFIAPYIFIFLIPAITMRSIVGERNEGTYELLATMPLRLKHIIWAKYLSCLSIVILALIPTGIYYISIYCLGAPKGNIDTGAVIGSYIGLLLLAFSFTAIGLFASTISQNVIIAFLIGVFSCFFTFQGFEFLAGIGVNDNISTWLSELGMNRAYESVSRGVLDLRDFCCFLSYSVFFLLLSYFFMEKHPRHLRRAGQYVTFGLMGIVVINYLTVSVLFRIDFTAEKRYTLSPISKQILSGIAEELKVAVFLDGELPAGFRRLRNATKDLLSDLQRYSGGKIKYSFIDPGNDNEKESMEILAKRGIEPTRLSVKTEDGLMQKTIYPVAVILYGDQEFPISLLQQNRFSNPEEVLNNSVQNLEYLFSNTIKKVTDVNRPIVAFTEGHGELTDLEAYDGIHTLAESYQVGRLNLDSVDFETLRKISVIAIAKPRRVFTENEKFKIDYFVQHGGKLLWAINQVEAELDSMRFTGEQVAVGRKLNLDDMLFRYGVRINYNLLVDLNCAQIPLNVGNVGGANQFQLVPWLFYPVFIPQSENPIVRHIDGVKSEFVSTIDTLAVPGVQKEIILSSSPFSKVLDIPQLISLQLVEQEPKPEEFKGQPHITGVALSGKFPSVFKNRPVPEGILDTFVNRTENKTSKMLVLADGNWMKNEHDPETGRPYPLGWDRASQQQYGNKTFLLNSIDYLTDELGIISLRSKELKLRLLDKALIKRDKRYWQFLNVGLPPLLLLLIGILQQWLRRRKYTD